MLLAHDQDFSLPPKQVHRAINGQFYCRIVASNGEVLFISETYQNKNDLVHAANVVRAYAAHAQILDYAA